VFGWEIIRSRGGGGDEGELTAKSSL